MSQCQGKSKQSGAQCKKSAVPGRAVCEIHGGKSLAGIASPLTVTGRYSKNLPTRLISRYHEAKQDGQLLALRDDLALIDARLEDVLAKVDTGETGETWHALQEMVHAFEKAERAAVASKGTEYEGKYRAEREEAMRTIIVLCQEGMADYAAWNEVKSLLEQRRKTAETEHKRLVAMQQMVTTEQLMLRDAKILDILRRNVTDRDTLVRLAREFNSLSVAESGART